MSPVIMTGAPSANLTNVLGANAGSFGFGIIYANGSNMLFLVRSHNSILPSFATLANIVAQLGLH